MPPRAGIVIVHFGRSEPTARCMRAVADDPSPVVRSIVVVDNGTGLAMKGRYNLIELSARKQGPAVLGERIASLNGDAIVDSTDAGLRLEITLPLGWKGYA